MKIRVLPLLALLLLPLCAGAAEVESGAVYCFSQADFSLSEESLTGVFFTDVPEAAGSVMLGSRKLRAGDAVPADRLAEMTLPTQLISLLDCFGKEPSRKKFQLFSWSRQKRKQ